MKKLLSIVLCFCITNFGAVEFDGVDDGLSAASVSFGVSVATVTFWLYIPAFNDTDDLALETSVNSGNNDGCFYINPNSGSPATGTFAVSLQSSTDATVKQRMESCTRPSAAAWHHYAVVLDNSTASGDIKIYIDGTEQSTTVVRNTKNQSGNLATETLYFMSRNLSTLNCQGTLSEVCVFNYELTGSQIAILASSRTKGPKFIGLIHYWPLDDVPDGASGDADTFVDRAGTANATGDDGADNAGLIGRAENYLSYP